MIDKVLPVGWRLATLKDLVFLQRGFDITKAQQKQGNVPVISSSGIGSFHDTAMASGPGVVVGRKGSVGTVHFTSIDYWPHDTTLWSKDLNGNDPRYVYYFLRTLGLQRFDVGNSNPTLNRNHIHVLPVTIPPLAMQARIAAYLATFDDLIENNCRRIKLLEESARLLYREWFVHLRFPGHEHVNIVGGVPKEWTACTAFDAMHVMSGGTPKTDVADYWNGKMPFFTPKDAVDTPYVRATEKHVTERGLSSCNSQLFAKNTLFITARGTVGNLNLAQVPMTMNQSCYALRGKDYLSQFFLYGALKEGVQQFKSRAGGAVFDAIVVNTFKLIPFHRPPEPLVMEYTNLVEPVFEQIDCLEQQSRRLREARDLLLPRLMSGQLAAHQVGDLSYI